ncbi:ABC transporter ATP-binding protein, partial [Thermoflexus hugenholtzii]
MALANLWRKVTRPGWEAWHSPGLPILEVSGVSMRYDDVVALEDISFTAEAGERIAIVGPNGAGKSTFMGLASGLLAPSTGAVSVFGENPRTSSATRARIGLCPEGDAFFPGMSCREFLAYLGQLSGLSVPESRRRAREVLAELGLAEFGSREPLRMSKGERQRAKLAQALLHRPDLLLLDEPLSGMDPLARIDVTQRICALGASGATVVVSSHILSEVEAMTSTIIVMNAGKVIASGRVAQIRAMLERFPHRIRIACARPALLAKELLDGPGVVGLELGDEGLVVRTTEPSAFYGYLNDAIARVRPGMQGFWAEDQDLASVFQYLVP